MKTLCVLVAVLLVVAAAPDCLPYCDKLHSGWQVTRRSDCNCGVPQKQLRDGVEYKHDLQSILYPVKSQNRPPIFKGLHKNQENDKISLTSNIFSGFVNSMPNEIKHNKIKRSYDGDIPEEKGQNQSITSKSSDDVLNNINISEKKLTDCVDLRILINIRKKKNITKSKPNALNKNEHLNDYEINTEIKGKCDQATMIIQQSVADIKERPKYFSRRKYQNVNVTPKIDVISEVTDETTPVTDVTTPMTYTNEDITTFSTVKTTTPDDEPYTDTITTTDNRPIFDSGVKDFNLPATLEDNSVKETTDNYYNLKDLNYTVPVIMEDNTTNTTDNSSINANVNTTSTKLKNIQIRTGNKSDLSYNLNDELTSEQSLDPLTLPEKIKNKSMLMTDYSNKVKESTAKTVPTDTINLNENKTSHRDSYNENEVPIIKIITREYPNNTISSVINGTEILPNSDFEEKTLINNNKTENTSDTASFKKILTESGIQSRSDVASPSTSKKQTFGNTSPIINGRLYFEYRQGYIPVRFFQTPKGHLQLSLDLNAICNKLIRKGKRKHNSPITTLCQYLHYRS